jgi:hypothetical protein
VLRKIFGPKRKEITGNWRNLHNEEIHDVFCPSQALLGLTKLGVRDGQGMLQGWKSKNLLEECDCNRPIEKRGRGYKIDIKMYV